MPDSAPASDATQIPPAPLRVLSGMRPTGKLHLGNYMGALHNWVRLQHEYECFFFIADIHALTTEYADPTQVKQNTVDVALDFLAAGLDPSKCTIFIQSHVHQHAELHLMLSMMTPLGWLERVPTYKEQLENLRGKDLATYGFLGYPLLQSADILLYRPQYVPVGQDQVSHIELTREIARRFNSLYKTSVFPEPEALLTPTPKLPGVDGRKMSKSYGNTIGLTESPYLAGQKIAAMSTNGQRIRQTDPGNPDLCPIGDMHKVFSSAPVLEQTQTGCRSAKIRCETCKSAAFISINDLVFPMYQRRMELESKIDDTWDMLLAQSEKAAQCAEATMAPVREAMNISRSLGSVRRYFGQSEADDQKRRDLSEHADWLSLPVDQRSNLLRNYWRNNIVPYNVRLTTEANRKFATLQREIEEPFLTVKKKRVLVLAPWFIMPGIKRWIFHVPSKSFEVLTLLVWHENKWLDDFIIPQKFFSTALATFKKNLAQNVPMSEEDSRDYKIFLDSYIEEGKVPMFIEIREQQDRFSMRVMCTEAEHVDITDLLSNYEPLR